MDYYDYITVTGIPHYKHRYEYAIFILSLLNYLLTKKSYALDAYSFYFNLLL